MQIEDVHMWLEHLPPGHDAAMWHALKPKGVRHVVVEDKHPPGVEPDVLIVTLQEADGALAFLRSKVVAGSYVYSAEIDVRNTPRDAPTSKNITVEDLQEMLNEAAEFALG